MLRVLSVLALLGLSACAEVPQLAAPPLAPGPAPAILPLEPLLAQIPAPGQVVPVDPGGLTARAARLRARGAAMRGPVADPATRARLLAPLG